MRGKKAKDNVIPRPQNRTYKGRGVRVNHV